jgi:hypothetical protein
VLHRVFADVRIAPLAAALLCTGCQLFQPQKTQPTEQQSLIGSGVSTKQEKGAAQAKEIDVTHAEEHDDIFQIASLLPSNPWLRQSGKVVGLQVPAYFVSSATRKGAFVPGTILAWVYGFEAGPDGKAQRVPLHVWEYDRTQAMDWRITKTKVMGNPYMFLLRWPEEMELSGRYIELELGYERVKDKTVVTSSAKRLRVPADDLAPLPPTAAPPPTSRMANTRRTG